MVGLEALVDFPPGPRDRLDGVLLLIAELVEEGLLAPTHTFGKGQRNFVATEAGVAQLGEPELPDVGLTDPR
jgi:hypothetical protein